MIFSQRVVPEKLLYPFDSSYCVEKMLDVSLVGSGKSQPIKIMFFLRNHRDPSFSKTATVILKTVTSDPKKYRMESNVANFFSESGLVDAETTYKIFHLAQEVVLIEFVPNIGTLNSLV